MSENPDDNGWMPIDTYNQLLWDSEVVIFRDEDGVTKIGSYGYEDESYNPETGDESLYGAYHDEDGNALNMTPVEWKRIDKERE